jgi:UDPglucose 6-dehydrogenase
MRVTMMGTGYVGLVSGACFADFGNQVVCVDQDAAKIDQLAQGKCPIFEPFLDALIARNTQAGRLSFATESGPAIHSADAVFIAVGTPSRRGDGFADLSFVYDAAREIAAELDGFTVIATKSTVPVGTGDEVDAIVRQLRPNAEFAVVSNPEFLREGAAIEDFKRPDRVVVGTEDERARRLMAELYRPLYINETPMLFTSRRTAELIKYASNAFLATKITFINEMAELCEKVGANVQEVARGMGLGFRRLLLSQRCFRPGRHRATLRRADPNRGDGDQRQQRAQIRHGAEDHRGLRRQRARQAPGGSRIGVQAEHRRYAGGAEPVHSAGAGGRRRRRARL